MTPGSAVVTDLRLYPIKSVGAMPVTTAMLDGETGAFAGDREFAMADAEGEFLTGKRTAAVHRIQSTFEDGTVTLDRADGPRIERILDGDHESIHRWLSAHFEESVELVRNEAGGFPDDTNHHGPTVISTGTIGEIARWYDGIDAESIRRRFRANIEIGGVPPFWEDQLIADEGQVVRFRIGEVPIDGVNPCARCVVPSRDPDTGEEYPWFREIFIENRRRTIPRWLDSDRFDHPFRVMINTGIPAEGRGRSIAVGDTVSIVGKRPV